MTDITENGKYYIPDISEFHVGFEFEVLKAGSWEKCEITENMLFHGDYDGVTEFSEIINKRYAYKGYRVKALDHDDIVSCGWEFHYKDKIQRVAYKIGHIALDHYPKDGNIWIGNVELGDHKDDAEVLFKGIARNKSELQFIMNALGIIK